MNPSISVQLEGNITELTLITPIIEGHAPILRATLESIQKDPGAVIGKISTIHYARWALFDDDTRLLFTSNFDGSFEQYLRDFATKLGDGLDKIWGHCVGYPTCNPFDPFYDWVQAHQIKVPCYYAAYPKATVKQVTEALRVQAFATQFIRGVTSGAQPS